MKRITMLLLVLLALNSTFAQKAEPVPSYAKEHRPLNWYRQQVKAWQNETDKNPKDEEAWYNLFKAARILCFQDTANKAVGEERNEPLVKILNAMEKQIPNSYEYNFCKWQLGGNNMSYYPYLEKALAIGPERHEHIDYMINIGEMERNIEQRNEYSIKKIQTGQMSAGMMYYNYNTLIGLERNAILLTSGDNDTYPAWAVQAKGVRKDVKVLNIYLLHIKSYREKVFAELGVKNIDIESEEEEHEFFNERLVQHLSKNTNKYPVYIALTSAGCNKHLESIQQDLYLTGLAYAYKTTSFDNIAVLKKNAEQLFALDYIDKGFYEEISEERVKDINRNYVVPMLKLYQHYDESGDMQKKNWIKEKLILISKGTEDEETVLKYLD